MTKSRIEQVELSASGVEAELKQAEKDLRKADALIKKSKKKEEVKPVKLIPIFIGTELEDLVHLVDEVVKEKFPTHTIAVLSPQVFGNMVYQYEVQSLSKEEQQQIANVQKNEKMTAQAEEVAVLISTFQFYTTKAYTLPQQFKAYELRDAYQSRRNNLSHKQINEILNFLLICGFAKEVDVDVKAHEMRYEITITNDSKVKQLERKNSAIRSKIMQLNFELDNNQQEITDLTPKIVKKENLVPITDEGTLKKLRAKTAATSKRKKAANESTANSGEPDAQLGL